MVQTGCLFVVPLLAFFPDKACAVRGPRFLELPKLELRTLSLHEDQNSRPVSACMLGLAADSIGAGAHSNLYTLNKSQFLAMKDKYAQDHESRLIFKDLQNRMDPTKEYVIKLIWLDLEARLTEFAAQAEAAELGAAPPLAAGWMCQLTKDEDTRLGVLVMERMAVSLRSVYVHLCRQLTEDNRAEVTRLAALAERAVVGVLALLAQRGIKLTDAHLSNFALDVHGRARAIDFGIADVDKQACEGGEARKLIMFRRSLMSVWRSTKYALPCLTKGVEAVSLRGPGSTTVAVGFDLGSPESRDLKMLGPGAVELLMREPFGWDAFRSFVDIPLGRDPLVAGLLD